MKQMLLYTLCHFLFTGILNSQLAKEYIADLKENDFRKGNGFGAPYECFYPPAYKQNPLYLATVACPYIVFKLFF